MFPYLLQSLWATLFFSLYLLPPGYVLAWLLNVAGFRRQSLAEQFLWSLALSYPLSCLCAVLVGGLAGQTTANGILLGFTPVALLLVWRYRPDRQEPRGPRDKATWMGALCLGAVAGLAIFATCAVFLHGRLEEPVCSNDWYIRLPVQWAAGRGDVPPHNPLFTLAGQNPPMRYYYFFYVFCGLPMRLLHFSARAALVAGDVWAGITFFAAAWLAVKYLLVPSQAHVPTAAGTRARPRQLALWFFVASLITGLDLIPTLLAIAANHKLYPSVYWWSQFGVSSWPGFLPFIPHHFMGMACALVGYLLLTMRAGRRAKLIAAAVAALCFAALLGTSTFLAITAFCCAGVFGAMSLLRRDWLAAGCVALALAGAAVVDAPYIRSTFLPSEAKQAGPVSEAAAQTGHSNGKHFEVVLLHFHHAEHSLEVHWKRPIGRLRDIPAKGWVFLALELIVLYIVHYGFFLFVLGYTAREDLKVSRGVSPEARALWCFFLTSTALGVLVSSEPLQGGLNDMGRLATLLSRVVLTLWAAPLLLRGWQYWRSGVRWPNSSKFVLTAATAFALVGLCGTAFDVLDERFYLPMLRTGKFIPVDPFGSTAAMGESDAELAAAWDEIGRQTPSDATVQANPNGPLQRPVLLYLNRRVAAGDVSCETSFGGDTDACVQQNVRPLLALYGQGALQSWLQVAPNETSGNFAAVCRSERLSALIAVDRDPAWAETDSWVWQEPTMYAGQHVRVLRCPAS